MFEFFLDALMGVKKSLRANTAAIYAVFLPITPVLHRPCGREQHQK
jgi:hypothetical protein